MSGDSFNCNQVIVKVKGPTGGFLKTSRDEGRSSGPGLVPKRYCAPTIH